MVFPTPADDSAMANAALSVAATLPASAHKAYKQMKDGKKNREVANTSNGNGASALDTKSAALLKQMADELSEVTQALTRLRSDVDALKQGSGRTSAAFRLIAPGGEKATYSAPPTPSMEGIAAALQSDASALVALAVRQSGEGSDEVAAPFVRVVEAEALHAVDTEAVARLGYAFSSVPKVALLRLLLTGGEQSAAALGEQAGLTTGSLYHHLRELIHAGVIRTAPRSRFVMTERGRRATLLMLALTSEE